jgi:hypothetical protein
MEKSTEKHCLTCEYFFASQEPTNTTEGECSYYYLCIYDPKSRSTPYHSSPKVKGLHEACKNYRFVSSEERKLKAENVIKESKEKLKASCQVLDKF